MINNKGNYLLGLLTIMLICLAFITNPLKVSACDCAVPENANDALMHASAVFTGEVITIKEVTMNGEKYHAVLISVSKIWKGIEDSQVIVYTSWSSCQFDFVEGKEYLLYPFEQNGKLEVIDCGRSAEVSDAKEDLIALGEGQLPTNDVQLEDEFDPHYFGIKIIIFLVIAGIITFAIWRVFRKRTL